MTLTSMQPPLLRQAASADATRALDLSIVVPLCNEQGNVAELVARVRAVLEELHVDSELVLVDDGSSDGTWEEIRRLASTWGQLRAVQLSRNFGHQHALLAGLTYARGRALVTMDGDLQHPPETIRELFGKWKEGYRIVMTSRKDEGVAPPLKRLSSSMYYRIFSAVTGVAMSEGSSDFRLLDRSVLEQIIRFNDKDVFLRGMVQWIGYDSTTVPFRADVRHAGRTKYTLRKMLRFAGGAMVSFTTKPLRAGIWLGLLSACLALTEFIYMLIEYALGRTVPGWSSIVALLSLMFAALFFVVGILGIYVARIHEVLQNRPRFVVSDTIGPPPAASE